MAKAFFNFKFLYVGNEAFSDIPEYAEYVGNFSHSDRTDKTKNNLKIRKQIRIIRTIPESQG